ncbi:Conserved_hypothetical protein [Hexamita inflata]|uniref:Uncharacterized protein n=1 Tax=Hexamita inflata TaxID=28002 RepID=A0AA86P9H0_9EUKA|nr:Conserved hypothetical protein [Hexamita inflata]CAI9934552.1 Conserved hypothetical protein [Hexamita inflata]
MNTAQFTDTFKEHIRQLFGEQFQRTFTSDRDVVEFYKKRDKNTKIPWEELAARLNKTTAACYKYFINTFCKNVLEAWPQEILLQTQQMVDQLCKEAFPTTNFKQTKRKIIDQVSDFYKLRGYTNYHFDTLYFRMYNRVEKNYKDFEETHVNCKIPQELVHVYMSGSNDFSKLQTLAGRVMDDTKLLQVMTETLEENSGNFVQ